jgi:hypothetical protein
MDLGRCGDRFGEGPVEPFALASLKGPLPNGIAKWLLFRRGPPKKPRETLSDLPPIL